MIHSLSKIYDIFNKLKERPDKENEIAIILKDALNDIFGEKIKCKRVFTSKGNGSDPYYVSVIPNKPENKILKKKFLTEYDIDIDLSSFISKHNKMSLTVNEMVAWLLHELAANVLTDETFLRFKKFVVKYYDTKNSCILNTIDAYSKILWIGIFSRTRKSFTTDKLTDVNIQLKNWGVSEYWDSAVLKYISATGGDAYKITDEYVDRIDKTQFREFNELARKYSSYALKYNNTDYSTMVKYIMNTTDSELVKYYISKEPQSVPIASEKMIYLLFDDNKILLENGTDVDSVVELYDQVKLADLIDQVNALKKDIDNIDSEANKLLCSVKLKELSKIIDKKYEECEKSSENILQDLKYEIETLINKLTAKEVSEKISVMELE